MWFCMDILKRADIRFQYMLHPEPLFCRHAEYISNFICPFFHHYIQQPIFFLNNWCIIIPYFNFHRFFHSSQPADVDFIYKWLSLCIFSSDKGAHTGTKNCLFRPAGCPCCWFIQLPICIKPDSIFNCLNLNAVFGILASICLQPCFLLYQKHFVLFGIFKQKLRLGFSF